MRILEKAVNKCMISSLIISTSFHEISVGGSKEKILGYNVMRTAVQFTRQRLQHTQSRRQSRLISSLQTHALRAAYCQGKHPVLPRPLQVYLKPSCRLTCPHWFQEFCCQQSDATGSVSRSTELSVRETSIMPGQSALWPLSGRISKLLAGSHELGRFPVPSHDRSCSQE